MRRCCRPRVGLVLALLQVLASPRAASAQAPVQKVLQMLTDMKAKGMKEIEREKTVFDDYGKVVVRRSRDLSLEIASAKARIEKLVAAITKLESSIEALTGQITTIDAEASGLESDLQSSAERRDSEHAAFLAEQTSYTESLYALDRASQLLKSQGYDRAQATALLQAAAKTSSGMRRVLAQLELVQVSEQASRAQPSGAPAVAAYEFQSSSIIDMLEQLRRRFREELGNLEKEEMNMAHAYGMEQVHVRNALANLKAEREALTASKARKAAESAASKGELSDTRASLAEAEKFLAEITSTFRSRNATFESNQQVRSQEVQALGEAIEILSTPAVVDKYAEHVKKTLLQLPPGRGGRAGAAPTSFLQRASSGSSRALRLQQAEQYLRGRARALRSDALAGAAAGLGRENPFAKVAEMIESLLERLKEEAASEADHKSYCDEELHNNKLKRDKMSSAAARLHAEIEEKAMAVASQADQITSLAQEQAALREAMTEATAARANEKEANLAAIKDSAEAQEAVKRAIAVLKAFYSEQGGFVQLSTRRLGPDMEAYTGMQGTKGGVIGMLEVIESDFVRVQAETKASEAQAEEQYTAFMAESEEDFERKHEAEFKLSLKKDQTEFEQEQLQKDLDATNEQLKMANAYYEELKPQCIQVHVTYEERAARRKDEIEALKEAYKILDAKSAS